jgi:hypothetical protein
MITQIEVCQVWGKKAVKKFYTLTPVQSFHFAARLHGVTQPKEISVPRMMRIINHTATPIAADASISIRHPDALC